MSERSLPSGALSATDSDPVELLSQDDRTEPEAAPLVRAVVAAGEDLTRSRRATLVSPIPALMAANMRSLAPADLEATPMPTEVRGDVTARIDDTERESLLMNSDDDYVVELE